VLGTKGLTVNNVAPTLTISGAATVAEGGTYELSISASDPAGAADALSYTIDWGDGSSSTVTAAQLAAAGGKATHVFADDENGPINATPRSISVTVSDGDGGSATQGTAVTVNNVAPTIALAGAATGIAGTLYTLNLGAITDPGQDTVSGTTIDWGDGSSTTLTAAQVTALGGVVTHTYALAGNYTIGVDLTDEDGSFVDAGSKAIVIQPDVQPEIVRLGDAPSRLTTANPNAWIDAWTEPGVTITHKANVESISEAWSAVSLNNIGQTVLSGGDVLTGDLGVSGRSLATSSAPAEIDGTEGLRFQFDRDAQKATFELARFFLNDDGTSFAEAARVQAFDENGNLVGERYFTANSTAGDQTVSVEFGAGFRSVVVSTGALNGGTFVYGAYANANGSFGTAPGVIDGKLKGSDFVIDSAEFEFAPAVLQSQETGPGAFDSADLLGVARFTPVVGWVDSSV
jgi:large repetitive protein